MKDIEVIDYIETKYPEMAKRFKEILDEAMKYRIIAESSTKAERSEMSDGEIESNENAKIIASTYALCLSQIGKEKFAESYAYVR